MKKSEINKKIDELESYIANVSHSHKEQAKKIVNVLDLLLKELGYKVEDRPAETVLIKVNKEEKNL